MGKILSEKENKLGYSKFDIIIESIFLIGIIYLFLKLKDSLPDILCIFMVKYFLFDLITFIFRNKIDKSKESDYWISIINYWFYIILTACINMYLKVDIEFLTLAIIFLTIYYRAYDLVFYSTLTPFSKKTLFLIFIIILLTVIMINDGIYNFLLAILTCIIGLIDVKGIQKLLDIEIKSGYELDEARIIKNKFSIIKMLLVIYPAMGIGNYIIAKFHEFADINYPNIGNNDIIITISLKLIIALYCYIFISEVFSSKNLKKFIESSYIKPIEKK